MVTLKTTFAGQVGIEVPLICGAMYPCSNPELIAATSEAGGIGIIQPIAMEYVHRHKLREGIRLIRSLTDKPIGFNALVEASSNVYLERMKGWIDIALEEGVRFFVTALGKPDWVVERAHSVGGIVYHDVTRRDWAEKALAAGVDGLICVNSRAGGHAGEIPPKELLESMADLGFLSSVPGESAMKMRLSTRSTWGMPGSRWEPVSSPPPSAGRTMTIRMRFSGRKKTISF